MCCSKTKSIKSVICKIFLFITVSRQLFSCVNPDPITQLSPDEKDLYVTNRDKSINFSEYKTYFIDDSVHTVSKEFGTTTEDVVYAPVILETVETELQKSGFTKVGTPQDADVGISVSILKFQDDVPAVYYPYLGGAGYFGYVSPVVFGYPGYGYGFPPYYGYYQIEVGSISIEMFDLKQATISSTGNTLNVIWSALLAGSLADGTTDENNRPRIINSIKGAFQQSPYLKDGK